MGTMLRFAAGKKNKKAAELKQIKRRARDSFSTPGNIFLKYATYMVEDDEAKKKANEAFLYGNKKGRYKYISLEQLPCGDMFRNKHHMQYDPTADWHVPVNDVYYLARRKKEVKKPAVPVKAKASDPPKLKQVLKLRPRRMTDRRKSMNPRGIYERPPMNPDPKGMYNGFGRKPTFVPPPTPPPEEESSSSSSEEEDPVAPRKLRVKDVFKGHGAKKASIFMTLKLEEKKKRQSIDDPPTPPPAKVESSSSSEAEARPQKLVKRRVKDKLRSGSASSRSSIFIKWERTLEDDDDPCSREPLFKYGGNSDSSEEPPKREKASYEKYAICYRKHDQVADVCLACEKDETYGLFTESLKSEPWKLPMGKPDPKTSMVIVTPGDKKKKEGVPHSRLPVCYMFDHEVDHTYHAKKAAATATEKAKMRKHLSKTLRKLHCHLYKPEKDEKDPAAAPKRAS